MRSSRTTLLLALCLMLIAAAASAEPRREVMELAERAFLCGRARGEITRDVMAVVDYSLPSTERRFWLIDMATRKVALSEFVAHGRNTGENRARRFSNRSGSKQSSLGLFRADNSYEGKHGYSLRLDGLEKGINDRARERAIVIHGADYVSESFIAEHGRLGRSWGCPTLRREVSARVIDRIKDGGAVFIYHPSEQWLGASPYLEESCAARAMVNR